MRLTGCLSTCLLAFIVTLALIIGWRLPDETRVIAAGVLTGVAVSVPTSLLVSAVATRMVLARYVAAQAAAAADAPEPEPQVVVVAAPPQAAPPQPRPQPNRAAPVSGYEADSVNTYTTDVPGARRFTIIGGTGADD